MDVTDYRDPVLEILLDGQHFAREVCELRFNLFLRAANAYAVNRNRELLEPFPPCFFDNGIKERHYDNLSKCVSSMPSLSDIKKDTSLPEENWMLLHWIFTNKLDIEVMKESPVSDVLVQDLRETTKLLTIPSPSKDCIRFDITHPDGCNSTTIFRKYKKEFGSFYAFHGSPIHNFHSIIHRGLRCCLNVRSAHGPGTYVTSDLHTAIKYAGQKNYSSEFHKNRISDGMEYCVAIVEVITHPSIKMVQKDRNRGQPEESKSDDTSSNHYMYYVVDSDELMRLKHLVVRTHRGVRTIFH